MVLRNLRHVLAPGLGAAAAGLLAELVWDDWIATLAAAAVGAMASTLTRAPGFDDAPRPALTDAAALRRPRSQPPAGGDMGEGLSTGLGRLLLEQLPVGIVLISPGGYVIYLNPVAGGIFGRQVMRGFHMNALRSPKLLETIGATLREGTGGSIDFTMPRAEAAQLKAVVQPISAPAIPEAAEDHPAVLVVIEDVTQSHRADQLHRDFVANASHELKTPLAAISGLIETLQGHAKEDAEATERFLGIMSTQADRMKRLVNDLLSLNRIEINERVAPRDRLAVKRIVTDTVEALSPLSTGEGARIEVFAPDDTPVVLGHREELTQVFLNLMDNALKYGRPGSTVRIEAHEGAPEFPGMIGISIADEGPGIPREHIPRLTERFYRVSVHRSREKGGTGLGLAIVKHVLNRHRGKLEVQSKIGEGSVFTVWLPVAEASAPGG